MKKRFYALLAALAVLLGGCAPVDLSDQQQVDITGQLQEPAPSATEAEESAAPVEGEVRVAYDPSDSLNPYTMTSQLNRQLVPLLYDSLTRPDKTWRPENLLAREITQTDGKQYVVKLRGDALFWDGTRLDGKDVIYSFTTAVASDSNWKQMLQNVSGCSVNSDGDVVFRLYSADADFPALLSFPIVKEGTAGEDFPVGVSKYYVSGTWRQGVVLEQNPLYWQEAGSIKKVLLVGVSDPGALGFSLRTGDVDLVYSDLSDPELSNLSAQSAPVSLNNLVYVGINGSRGLLAEPAFRQALSLAVNRDELVQKAYVSRARATMYPLNPDFYRMESIELSAPRDLTRAGELLDELGLRQKDDDGWRLRYGAPVTLRLLVNSENAARTAAAALIAEQLARLGIRVEVVSQSFSQYQSSLAGYNYDLYIGETRLMDNMDFSLLLNGGALGYAAPYSEYLSDLARAYRATGTGVGTLCEAFSAQTPFIPLVFRQGAVSFERAFQAEILATEQDIFYNIMEW